MPQLVVYVDLARASAGVLGVGSDGSQGSASGSGLELASWGKDGDDQAMLGGLRRRHCRLHHETSGLWGGVIFGQERFRRLTPIPFRIFEPSRRIGRSDSSLADLKPSRIGSHANQIRPASSKNKIPKGLRT